MRTKALLAASVICLFLTAASGTPAAPQKWEYAEFFNSNDGVMWNGGGQILAGKGDDAGKSNADLFRRLGGTGNPADVSMVKLLNLVGTKGWELVAVVQTQGTLTYTFKRPLP